MTKKKHDEIKKSENPKSFSSFLKKRAPIYLGIIGLFMIFAYPALTEKNLESLLADDSFEGNERIAVEMVKFYKGTNDKGMTILQVIEEKINDKYSEQKIFNDEDTWAEFSAEATNTQNYEVVFVFSVENNQSMRYEWSVNLESGEISSTDGPSRIILQTVDHYD
ncbi:MAG: hypothetical protein QF559_04525 [Candidatus Nitrosopelagicus sp.]|nr:hypothetical protein [Candidatus Nitrosopelagicus sp.]